DSLGHEQVIHPGQVNLMTAGRGIAHTEDSVQDGARLHAAQLWIALPDAERQREPAFQNYPELPVIDQGGWRVTVLAGSLLGRSSPATVYTPLVGLDLASRGAADVTLPLEPTFEYGAMVLRGSASVGGEAITTGELLYFAPGRAELRLQCDAEAQILLLGGEPFGQPVLLWWNFVGRTQDDMAEALADWQASPNQGGRFGTVRPGSTADALTPPVLEKLKVPSAS
ncbi:MAG: pirin family protein, partial [Ottowia sp.]|nr:pirin family protein [Ottowia sp.]